MRISWSWCSERSSSSILSLLTPNSLCCSKKNRYTHGNIIVGLLSHILSFFARFTKLYIIWSRIAAPVITTWFFATRRFDRGSQYKWPALFSGRKPIPDFFLFISNTPFHGLYHSTQNLMNSLDPTHTLCVTSFNVVLKGGEGGLVLTSDFQSGESLLNCDSLFQFEKNREIASKYPP